MADSIEITGIPESNETDLPKLIENVFEKLNTQKEEILSVKRLAARQTGPSPVLVKVRQESTRKKLVMLSRETVITAKDLMPNITSALASDKVVIREALTPYCKSLLWHAKQELKGTYKFIWVREGKVLVRKTDRSKVYKIRSQSDIQTLLKSDDS